MTPIFRTLLTPARCGEEGAQEACALTVTRSTAKYADPIRIDRVSPSTRQHQHQTLVLNGIEEAAALRDALNELLEKEPTPCPPT